MYELFHKKLTEHALMKDPKFLWCCHVSRSADALSPPAFRFPVPRLLAHVANDSDHLRIEAVFSRAERSGFTCLEFSSFNAALIRLITISTSVTVIFALTTESDVSKMVRKRTSDWNSRLFPGRELRWKVPRKDKTSRRKRKRSVSVSDQFHRWRKNVAQTWPHLLTNNELMHQQGEI